MKGNGKPASGGHSGNQLSYGGRKEVEGVDASATRLGPVQGQGCWRLPSHFHQRTRFIYSRLLNACEGPVTAGEAEYAIERRPSYVQHPRLEAEAVAGLRSYQRPSVHRPRRHCKGRRDQTGPGDRRRRLIAGINQRTPTTSFTPPSITNPPIHPPTFPLFSQRSEGADLPVWDLNGSVSDNGTFLRMAPTSVSTAVDPWSGQPQNVYVYVSIFLSLLVFLLTLLVLALHRLKNIISASPSYPERNSEGGSSFTNMEICSISSQRSTVSSLSC
ncbi:serine-rich and transmembrane domain-containing protein 1 [Arapaima gigas]